MTVFYASPTKLSVWRQCRRRYKFRYVDRIPTVNRPWLAFYDEGVPYTVGIPSI